MDTCYSMICLVSFCVFPNEFPRFIRVFLAPFPSLVDFSLSVVVGIFVFVSVVGFPSSFHFHLVLCGRLPSCLDGSTGAMAPRLFGNDLGNFSERLSIWWIVASAHSFGGMESYLGSDRIESNPRKSLPPPNCGRGAFLCPDPVVAQIFSTLFFSENCVPDKS